MSVLTPNMNLIQSTVAVDSGLVWEQNLNADLAILDGHNHSAGSGVQINPTGLDINSDLTFNANNAIDLRSARFLSQGSPLAGALDLAAVYVSGVDLWFNDVNGNQIQLTAGGAVNATSSGISSGTATASFVSGVLVVNAAPLTPANIQVGSVLLGNNVANSKFLTLSPPSAMAANFSLTLPNVPVASSVMTLDTSGNMGTVAISTLNFVPTGATIPFSGASTPAGYLVADGSAVSRSTYANLFALIGTTFGDGDGSTTFNLPDASGLLSFRSANIPPYIHSEWPFDEVSGNALNVLQPSGSFNLTQAGSVGAATGLYGGARGPTSGTDYFNWPASGSNATVYDSQTFIIEGWFKNSSAPAGVDWTLANKRSTNPSFPGWYLSGDTSTAFIHFNINNTFITSDSNTIPWDGQWHYIVCGQIATSGANNQRMYFDNVLQTSQNVGQTLLGASNNLYFGTDNLGNSFNGGFLEDWAYWNTVPATWLDVENIINTRWNGGAGSYYASLVPVNYIIKT